MKRNIDFKRRRAWFLVVTALLALFFTPFARDVYGFPWTVFILAAIAVWECVPRKAMP